MTDFASIGIEMDSRPVVEGTKALDALGEASARVEQKIRVSNGQMSDTAKIMQAQADQAKAAAQANSVLGGSTSALTAGQAQLIERFREQAATVGMSRSQLMAYQAAQMGVTEQTKEAVAAVKAHEDALKAKKNADDAARNSTNMLTDALKLLAAGYAALKIGEIIKDSAMQAARFETLGVVMGVVGKTAGYTKVQMDTASEAIAAQGITMLESRNSAIKLVQAHVDLTNASKLARIAQDAAVIGNINSSEAFERLVNGVSRGNVLILRNIGINVNLQAAYQQMADSLGKSTKELTENERVQARLNAVMERGSDIAGTYEASMGTAGKQILSMQRYISDLKTVFGETFNEVLTVAVMGLTSGLKDANGEVSQLAKNNQLTEWGHGLATIFVGIADSVGNAYTAVQKFDAFARHKDAQKAINEDFDAQSKKNFSEGSLLDLGGVRSRGQRIEAMRQSAIAQENADYEAQQVALSGHFDRFSKAYKEFSDARIAKQKADAAERLKVDQDYMARSQALLIANAGKSIEIQQAAQAKLAKEVYVGTPSFRDTEGRESKPTIDRADSTRLQNKLARIQEESAADKAYAEFSMQLDDMRHKAGELGDEEYFKNKKENLATIFVSEQVMYDKEVQALQAHHNSTVEETEKSRKAIADIQGKKESARTKYEQDGIVMDETERLRQKAVEMASQDASNKYISGLNAEAEKLEQSNGAHEKSRSAIERETVARLDLAVAYQQQFMAEQATSGASEKEVEQGKVVLKFLQDMRDARARIATAAATQESDLFSKRAADQAIQDWQRAGASISESLRNAFGSGGKAVGEMFKAYSEGVSGQLRAQKDLAAAKRLADDNPEKIEAINRAQLNGSQAQLKSYGDMAGAAQSYFEKGSAGYQAMAAASDVLRAAEVALSLVKGVNAVLTQGEGDPYSAFARMAAMAAIVTGLGVALTGGGGGGGMSAADRQKAQGAGSVLGDSNAKSDSIAHSIAMTAANSSTQINYLSGMLTSLQAIQTNIGSFASQLVQNTNISNPDVHLNSSNGLGKTVASWAAGGVVLGSLLAKIPVLGNLFDKVGTAIFGGKQSVADSGFTLDKTSLASVLSGGVNAKTYADITTSGGWFSKDKTNTQSTGLGDAANKQFGLIISSLADSIKQASGLLGVCSDDFTDKLNSFVIDIGKVSLKGLTGDEQQKALEAVFSKLGDQMAEWAVAGLGQFAKVGEGYLETLTRVATDYAKLDASLASVGMKFGAVGIASVGARENLIALAGGIDKFQSDTASFAQNFLTKGEQLAPVAKFVDDQLSALGLSWIKSRDDLKKEVLGLDLTTAAGQSEYAALMGLQAAFAATHAATIDLTKTEQEIADERKGLQDKLDDLTMTAIQLRAKERAGIADVNKELYDQVQAAQAAKDAIAEANTVLDLQGQLYNVLGDKAGAAAVLEKQHAAALADLTPAVADATKALWAAQAAESARQEELTRSNSLLDIQAQIYALTGDKVAAAAVLEQQHANALAALDPALREATQNLWDLQASAKASADATQAQAAALQATKDASTAALANVDNMFSVLQRVTKGTTDALSARIAAERSLSDAVRSTLASMKVASADLMDRAAAQAQIKAALAISKAGGPLPTADSLKDALSVLSQDASAKFATEPEYLKDLYSTKIDLSQLGDLADSSLSVDQQQLDSLNAMLAADQQQIDILKGIASALTIQQAQGGFQQAIVGAQANPYSGSVAGITSAYASVLGRAPDAAGLEYWKTQAAAGMSIDQITAFMKDSSEYKHLQGIPGFAGGGDHGGGWRLVGENGPELEATGPSRIFNASQTSSLMSRLSSPSENSGALLAAVKTLTEKIERLEQRNSAENVAMVKQLQAQVDLLTRVIYGGDTVKTQAVTS